MEEAIETNRRHWEELVGLHLQPNAVYDVPAFKAGRSTLLPVELEELGDVRGKTLLHLQCHIGLDTLSWARRGATVTGADFSAAAIRVARELAAELAILASFVESDVYRLNSVLQAEFDIVFASYGVVGWLPDFPRWARVAASYLKPGGVFYLLDGHPLGNALAEGSTPDALSLDFPYLKTGAVVLDDDGSYADRSAKLTNRRTVEFAHGLGEMVSALIEAGLQLDFLHEFPFAGWQRLSAMLQNDDGYWRLPGDDDSIPFLFSIKAHRPA
jgi:SAM-dependent methyltransferase